MDQQGRELERRYQAEPTKENLHQLAIYRNRVGGNLIDVETTPQTSNSILYLYSPIEMCANSYGFEVETYLAIQEYYNQMLKLVEAFAGRVIVLHNETWLIEGLNSSNRDQAYAGLNHEFFGKLEYLNSQNPDKYTLGLLQWNSSSGYQEYYHVWKKSKINYSDTEELLAMKSLVVSPSRLESIYIAGGRLDRTLEFLNNLRAHYAMIVNEGDEGLLSFWQRVRIGLLWKTTYGYAKLGSTFPVSVYRSSQDSRTHIESNIVGHSSGIDVSLPLNTFLRRISDRIPYWDGNGWSTTAVVEFDENGQIREAGRT